MKPDQIVTIELHADTSQAEAALDALADKAVRLGFMDDPSLWTAWKFYIGVLLGSAVGGIVAAALP